MTGQVFDVAVVGAGPAGCAAALVLRQSGCTAALIDPADPARRKIGETLPGAVRRPLQRLGIAGVPDLLPQGAYHACTANVSAWGTSEWTYQDGLRNPEGGGYHVNRAMFDHALRSRAIASGATFLPYRALSVAQATDRPHRYRVRLRSEHLPFVEAQWLVDATGRAAWLSRQFGASRIQVQQQASLVGWILAHPDDQDATTRVKSVPDGWWYTALLPGRTRVLSLQAPTRVVAALVRTPDKFLQRFNEAQLLAWPVEGKHLLEIRTSGSGLERTEPAAQERRLCIGDALFASDPLSSQGIYFSLFSGIRAGESIARSLQTPEWAAHEQERYEAGVREVYRRQEQALHYFYSLLKCK